MSAGFRLWYTVLVGALCFMLFCLGISGCHFHLGAFIISLIPVIWGFFALFTYRTGEERLAGWFAFIVAVLFILLNFEANVFYSVF